MEEKNRTEHKRDIESSTVHYNVRKDRPQRVKKGERGEERSVSFQQERGSKYAIIYT
jgi:hypothetical protein